MKEDYTPEKHHGWIIWLSIFAVLIIGVGIFFTTHFYGRPIQSWLKPCPRM